MDVRENDSFNKFWGWFGVMVQLAQEDITKIEQITEYPLVFALNYMAYMKDINQMREKEQRRQMAQLKR
jgi:hypothetical protein